MDINHLGTYKCLILVKSLKSCSSNCIVWFTIGCTAKACLAIVWGRHPTSKYFSTSTGFVKSQITIKYSLTFWKSSSDLQSKGSQLQNAWSFCYIKSFFICQKVCLVGTIDLSNPFIQHAEKGFQKATAKLCENLLRLDVSLAEPLDNIGWNGRAPN